MKQTGHPLKAYCEVFNLSQKELAAMVGVSHDKMRAITSGKPTKKETDYQISFMLGIPVAVLQDKKWWPQAREFIERFAVRPPKASDNGDELTGDPIVCEMMIQNFWSKIARLIAVAKAASQRGELGTVFSQLEMMVFSLEWEKGTDRQLAETLTRAIQSQWTPTPDVNALSGAVGEIIAAKVDPDERQ